MRLYIVDVVAQVSVLNQNGYFIRLSRFGFEIKIFGEQREAGILTNAGVTWRAGPTLVSRKREDVKVQRMVLRIRAAAVTFIYRPTGRIHGVYERIEVGGGHRRIDARFKLN